MSRPTPRKPRGNRRNNQQQGAGQIPVSDIDSDFVGGRNGANGNGNGKGYTDGGQQPQQQQQQQQQPQQQQRGQQPRPMIKSLPEMNLHVLRQYEPSIRSIISVAASTVVYVLDYDTGGWLKTDPQVEGTLFLCEQEPLVVGDYSLPRACVFVLNRKGLMNVVVDLAKVNMAEVTADLITLRMDDSKSESVATPPVLGFWIHGGSTTSSVGQFEPATVLERWRETRGTLETLFGAADVASTSGALLEMGARTASAETQADGGDPQGKATRAIGRRPSISELVAGALGGGGV